MAILRYNHTATTGVTVLQWLAEIRTPHTAQCGLPPPGWLTHLSCEANDGIAMARVF